MRLIDHLKATDEAVDAFAERAGEKRSTIRKIAYGQRQPSLPLAVKIERLTDGVVTAADMVLSSGEPMDVDTVPDDASSAGNIKQLSDVEIAA